MKQKWHWIITGAAFIVIPFIHPLLASANGQASSQPQQDVYKEAGWRIGLQGIGRGGMKTELGGSSYVQTLGIHAANPFSRSSSSGGGGYSDGFVDPDSASPVDNMTWNWGYDNANQYDASGKTLTFHRSELSDLSSQSLSVFKNESASADDSFFGAGVGLTAARGLYRRGAFNVAACGAVRGVWNQNASISASTYQEGLSSSSDSSTKNYDYVYDVSGVPMPGAPYSGDYYGPGPQIPVSPSSVRSSSSAGSSAASFSAANQIDVDVASSLYSFMLGPELRWNPYKRLALHLTPGFSINYLDFSADRKEVFTTTSADGSTQTLNNWSDSVNAGRWRLGLECSAGVDVDVYKGWTVGLFGGFDWQTQKAEVDVGPNTVSVDLSGYMAGVEFGKMF